MMLDEGSDHWRGFLGVLQISEEIFFDILGFGHGE